jgi:hypothetical protein
MAIEFYGDIAVSSKTGAVFFQAGLEDYGTSPQPSEAPVVNANFSQTPWSPWGKNNMLPREIAEDIENVGVLDAALDAKGKIGTGKGMEPYLLMNKTTDGTEELEWVSDSEIQDWMELNNVFEFSIDSIYDKLGYGWNCGSYVLNLGRKKIARVKRHDVYEARLEKKDTTTRLINNLYLSADWANARSTYETDKQVRIEMLQEGNELKDLTERVAANNSKLEYAFANRTIRNGRHYYPQPIYRSNKQWIKIARSVPAFKIAMFKNSITIKYKITIHPKFWENKVGKLEWEKYTPEDRQAIMDEYYTKIDNWLTGEDKAYKSIFTGGFFNEEKGEMEDYVKIDVLDDKVKDGKLLPDSGAAISEILFALNLNPALMGAGNPGGNAYGDTSGGSNIRESFLTQLMIMESERKANATVFNVVKKFNGWSERLEVEKTISLPAVFDKSGKVTTPSSSRIVTPRLVWRYPSGLLTTLDTGKSTKPENL